MAEAVFSVDQFSVDQFSCPVCLDLLKDPVAIPCGHSFCKDCINGCWDQEEHRGIYSCPQCRRTFSSRPESCRNTMLAEVVEKLKKTELQAASPAQFYAEPGDVECDFCTDRKCKAIKSCLMCLTSFCETHLKPHLERPALKKHTLVEACVDLQEKICSQHDKLMEIYCRNDQSFICYLCTMEEHQGHKTVTVKTARSEKQSELKEEQRKSQQRIQDKQKKVEELKQTATNIKSRAQEAVDNSHKIFTEMISSIEKRHSETIKLIRDQEKDELSKVEQVLLQMEKEIVDLQMRVTELEELSQTHDHIHFLQSFSSLGDVSGCKDSSSIISVHQHVSFDEVIKSLSHLKQRVSEFCTEEFNKIQNGVNCPQYNQNDHLSLITKSVQQQQASYSEHQAPSRLRKKFRIRDPNQGGRDITEEIMSRLKTESSPEPHQWRILSRDQMKM